jgi:S1-C subfamily serine protease
MARSPFDSRIDKFAIVHGVLKLVAIPCGIVLSQLCLMASVGLLTGSGWIRTLVALAVNLLVPLAIVDRLLPDDVTKAKGMTTDVLAVLWVGFPFLFALAGQSVTSPAMTTEAARIAEVGLGRTAALAYLLAGTDAAPGVAHPIPPAASASSSTAAPASAVPPASSAAGVASVPSAVPPVSASPEAGPPADAGAPATKEKTPAELFKRLSPSVVTIAFDGPLGMSGGGTGFLIDDQGTIATNHHVISSAKQLQIKFMNGAVYKKAELLDENADRDLALLRVKIDEPEEGTPKPDVEPLVLGDSEAVVVGERAIAIGNPLGLDHTLTDGLVSARRIYEGKPWIQMSVPVSPGNSGGPLFNMKGEVIGVITAQILGGMGGRAQNLNIAVPVNDLKKMIRSDYPKRRAFGSPGGSSQW